MDITQAPTTINLGFPVRVHRSWYPQCKMLVERCCAIVFFLIASPIILVAAFLVKITSHGPVFYRQIRVGRDGEHFKIVKIRTMVHDCEKQTGPVWSQPGDPRVTRVGRVLRDFHIDELPQIWNVICGQMSMIGPRPERPEIVGQLEEQLPLYRARLLVAPGLTGLAQLQLPADQTLDCVRRKLAHDLYYVQHMSPWLDLRLGLGTLFYLLQIPFRLSGSWLAIPRGNGIDKEYDQLIAHNRSQTEIETRPESGYKIAEELVSSERILSTGLPISVTSPQGA